MAKDCSGSQLLAAGFACGAALLTWAAVRRTGDPGRRKVSPQPRSLINFAEAIVAEAIYDKTVPSKKKTRRKAVRRLYGAAALLSFSVLADSVLEHYRGCFNNRAMYIPPVASSLVLAETVAGAIMPGSVNALRRPLFFAAVLTGTAGFGFHVYNISRREGGFSWLNLFYGAPLGAPGALAMAGIYGYCAEMVHQQSRPFRKKRFPRMREIGRALAGLSMFSMLGTVGEVLLLHFRGAFQDRFMYIPVVLPTLGALGLGKAALRPGRRRMDGLAATLKAINVMGMIGSGFHAYGIHRNMGGWNNWSQMLLQGPPLPAPPGFSGIALGGLGALNLMTSNGD